MTIENKKHRTIEEYDNEPLQRLKLNNNNDNTGELNFLFCAKEICSDTLEIMLLRNLVTEKKFDIPINIVK